MRRLIRWIWDKGIVSTFVTGLFVILPVIITVVIMSWFAGLLVDWLGPQSTFGRALVRLGEQIGVGRANETIATLLGWVIVLGGIWLIGLMVKTAAIRKAENAFHATINRLPLVKSIYGPVVQVVNLLKKDDRSDMKGMRVVYCSFGNAAGAGFLALLASTGVFNFQDQKCHAVYIPTSPVPMSGGIVFVPVERVTFLEMSVDDLMKIYFSLGVLASDTIPEQYVAA